MKLKWLALGMIFLALISTAAAAKPTLEITADPVRDIISSSGIAKFDLVLENVDKIMPARIVSFSYDPVDWKIDFPEGKIVVYPKDQVALNITITPPEDVAVGSHVINIYAEGKDRILGQAQIKVNIDEHAMPIDVRLEPLGETGPARTVSLTGEMENKEIKYLADVIFTFKSGAFEEVTFTESFRPLETKSFSKEIKLKPYLDPASYPIYVNAEIDGDLVVLAQFDLLVTKTGTLGIDDSVEKSTLLERHVVKITNLGNDELSELFGINLIGASRFFMFSNPKPTKIDEQSGVKISGWAIKLAPGESTTLQYSINYIYLVVILGAAIGAGLYFFFRYRKTFSISKHVRASTSKEEKTINVQITVKNLRGSVIKEVTVEDRVPVPLHLVSKAYHTLEPDIIKKDGSRINLVWKLDSLAPKEIRVLSYNVRSALKVIGKLALPAAKVYAKLADKKVVSSSNRPSLFGKEIA